MDVLTWLQEWYSDHCDGDWEHGYGIRINTLDNPGWSVEVSLEDTELETANFDKVVDERNANDWVQCFVEGGFFKGAGGPQNLQEILEVFRKWTLTKETQHD